MENSSLDKLENKSAPKTAAFIFLSYDRLDLIKNTAKSDVQLQKLQKQSFMAATQALTAERCWFQVLNVVSFDSGISPTVTRMLSLPIL